MLDKGLLERLVERGLLRRKRPVGLVLEQERLVGGVIENGSLVVSDKRAAPLIV
jgi:hypothetical protein